MRESPWTDEDRNYLLALMYVESDACPGCGNPTSEAWDAATARQWQIVEHECQACRIKDAVTADRVKDGDVRGRYITARRAPNAGG